MQIVSNGKNKKNINLPSAELVQRLAKVNCLTVNIHVVISSKVTVEHHNINNYTTTSL